MSHNYAEEQVALEELRGELEYEYNIKEKRMDAKLKELHRLMLEATQRNMGFEPTFSELEEIWGVARGTVHLYLQDLENYGYVISVERSGRKRYRPVPLEELPKTRG